MQSPTESVSLAARALVAAFADDPFYRAITLNLEQNLPQRRTILEAYFAYSLQEGQQYGYATMRDSGAAIWLTPQKHDVAQQAQAAKYAFLAQLLDADGFRNYQRILDFMTPRAEAFVGEAAWFLSILGVSPTTQGKGVGAALVTPVLALADQQGATSYLETFNTRALPFYQRLGFAIGEEHFEPTIRQTYWILTRPPQPSEKS